MSVTISGDTGVSQIQDGAVSSSAKIAAGAVAQADLDSTNKLAQCKAWCVFNGATTGTNAPIAGFNVTSVTRNAAGDYTINFTNAMADTNYATVGTCSNTASDTSGGSVGLSTLTAQTTSAKRIRTLQGGSYGDAASISIMIFGN